ncbi:MAG: four helix bundle protein [Kiritimatiellae bacterium]|nr:four helix bundle protein [Kiritimatiellia bacterium]
MDKFGAYQKALELFDLVVRDMTELRKDPRCFKLISQQVASADSICSNMEEGFGRLSRTEYVRFLDFSHGSAMETQGRYRRMKHWLPEEVVRHRVQLAGEIIAILTTSIARMRYDRGTSPGKPQSVREQGADYDWDTGLPLDT